MPGCTCSQNHSREMLRVGGDIGDPTRRSHLPSCQVHNASKNRRRPSSILTCKLSSNEWKTSKPKIKANVYSDENLDGLLTREEEQYLSCFMIDYQKLETCNVNFLARLDGTGHRSPSPLLRLKVRTVRGRFEGRDGSCA